YVYNPDNGDLAGWLRGDPGLEEVAKMNGYTSPRLGVRFKPGKGSDRLRIIAPDGQRFLTYVELMEAREAERLRAQAADQRVEAERQRTEAERQRAEAADQRAETERQRAETERQRAETERQRAETERQRAERLGEQLE